MFNTLLKILGNAFGAVSLNGDIYDQSQTSPVTKVAPSDFNSRLKVLQEHYTMDTIIDVDDEILGPFLPEGARVIDAILIINGSTGAGGIFDLGLKAFEDIDENTVAEDLDSLVQAADAGGQAVLKRALAASILGNTLGKIGKGGAQTVATCTEATTTTDVTPVDIEWFVLYTLES